MLATEAYAPGDVGRDGFDESQGCYFVQATEAGHCRFTITPPPGGLSRAVFCIVGPWKGKVHASAAGLAIRDIPRAAEGIFIFAIPQPIKHPTAVEVVGEK